MRLAHWIHIACSLAVLTSLGCANDERPEPPTILRDVAMIDDDVAFTHPFVPGHRTTMDGRIAIRVQGGPPGTQPINEGLSFFLFSPEALDEPIMSGPPGARILADATPFDVVFPPALDPDAVRLGHHTICDPTEAFATPGEHTNPYPCGPGSAHDCYDITVISSTSPGIGAQLWGTPVQLEVTHPKTAEARIVRVDLGEPIAGHFLPLTTEWTEPAVTRDGRLLTGRLGRAPRAWTNPNTGERLVRYYDLAYAVLPENAEPCDITGWTDFHPMSHAPYDAHMVANYGLAAYPFRDAEGQLIPDGEDLGGTYPWVDREGANVFMAGIPGRIIEQSETEYPRRCVTPGCESLTETQDWDRGFLVAGLWTHGKFVLLDGMINNQDWAVGVTPDAHYLVDLYRDEQGEDVQVRFGAGRFIDARRNSGGPYPPGYTHNANILDSLQNLPNHDTEAMTITPRDVVWIMSTGVGTDEIVFDDYLDPNAFILSNMQASVTQLATASGVLLSTPDYHNGQVRTLRLPVSVASLYVLEPNQAEDIHIQNAATSLGWKVPAYGLVQARTGRIEPVALGGIQGKGFWLSGASEIRYAVPGQTRPIRDRNWYVGLFVDPRGAEGSYRMLATFPDGSGIRLQGHGALQYFANREIIHEIALPETQGWMHLGWQLTQENRVVTLFHDGFPMDRFEFTAPLFEMRAGDLVIGSADESLPGVRGWIDDLKVLAHDVNFEVACNHAHGTLIAGDDSPAGRLASARYPSWAHDQVGRAAGLGAPNAPDTRFSCFHDYSSDYAAHLGNLPAGATSLRGSINFPEGPLRAGVPRPDSSQNPFCLSCHHAAGKGGLSVAALVRDPNTVAENDRRRQPLQPPRRVFGNIPPGWIAPGAGPGSPADGTQAPAQGLLIDRWVLPGPGARSPAAGTVHRH